MRLRVLVVDLAGRSVDLDLAMQRPDVKGIAAGLTRVAVRNVPLQVDREHPRDAGYRAVQSRVAVPHNQ